MSWIRPRPGGEMLRPKWYWVIDVDRPNLLKKIFGQNRPFRLLKGKKCYNNLDPKDARAQIACKSVQACLVPYYFHLFLEFMFQK